jgi:hypothetical protein
MISTQAALASFGHDHSGLVFTRRQASGEMPNRRLKAWLNERPDS